MTLSTEQYDQLLDLAFAAEANGLDRDDIVPGNVSYFFNSETEDLHDAWNSLSLHEQKGICYDLRDNLHEAHALHGQFMKEEYHNYI